MNKDKIQSFSDTWGQTILLWQRLRRPILQNKALTHTDKRILYGLYKLGSVTKKELAQQIVLEHSSLTRPLDRLESRGLIERNGSDTDKRFILLNLTTNGKNITCDIKKESRELLTQLLSQTNDSELEQTTAMMEKFQSAMEVMLDEQTKAR